MTPAIAVLAWLGGRSDLSADIPHQFARINREYRGATRYGNVYHVMGWPTRLR